MNWLIKIIIFQLIFAQALSYMSCLKSQNCSCQKHADKEEIEVTCGSSTVMANLMESIIEIQCKSDKIQWEQSFDQINVTRLNYKNCSLLDVGIYKTMSTLGISEVQSMKLINMKLSGSLERFYFSSLGSVKQLDISNAKLMLTNASLDISHTKLMLTNESFEGTPHLTKLFLRQNNIEEIPNGVFKHLFNLQVLDLGGNKISKIDSDLFEGIPLKGLILDSNHLTTLSLNVPSLKHLDVSNNRLISITVENLSNLVELSLNKNILITLPDQPFINTSLESIKYNYGNFTVPNKFLTSLDRLLKVHLKSLHLEKIPENMIWNSPNITELSLASNHLKELPVMFFRDSEKMKVLDLSKNQIEKINHELLRPLINLENLDLSNNLIVQINNYGLRSLKNLLYLNIEKNNIVKIEREAFNIPKLKYLKLAYNKISSLSSYYSFSFNYLDEVEDIDLSNNIITRLDPDWVNLVKLKNVNLASNNFTSLSIEEIQFLPERVKTNLKLNPLEAIDLKSLVMFAKAQELPLDSIWNTHARQISLSGNKLICDCRNYEFAKYLHNQMPNVVYKYLQIKQHLTCNDGTEFADVKLDSLTCDWKIFDDLDKTDCSECECTYRPFDNSAIMNCSNRNLTLAPRLIISSRNINYTELNLRNNLITKLPDYKHLNIRKLDVGYNNLTAINITQLPKNLTELHLEHNSLIKIIEPTSKNTLTNLNILTMSGNSWACDCEEKNTINFIHKYSLKIADLANITCSSSTFLFTQNMEICQENYELKNFKIMTASICLAVFGILCGLLLTLYNRYKIEIKIWLYSHNIKWPISEESLDQDKKYDAFLSYSHKDEELVVKHLVPGLEGGSKPFKLCLHLRDWVIGDWIPAQIARSVDESRRTIIVLSRNYLDSVWGRTEFRAAYSSALNERRNRIIVILYGDISTNDLDTELKAYLSMNTYIKWGDNQFWEKLRYALPHKPNSEKKIRTKIIVPDKLNPLVLA